MGFSFLNFSSLTRLSIAYYRRFLLSKHYIYYRMNKNNKNLHEGSPARGSVPYLQLLTPSVTARTAAQRGQGATDPGTLTEAK